MIDKSFYFPGELRRRSFGRLLDIGCGDGSTLYDILSICRNFDRCDAIDPEEEAISDAWARFERHPDRGKISFHHGPLLDAPLLDGSFDTILMIDVLHHFADPVVALDRAYRLLAREGLLVVVEMRRDHLSDEEANGRDIHGLKANIDRQCGVTHNDLYSRAEIMSFVADLPLRDLRSCSFCSPLEWGSKAATRVDCISGYVAGIAAIDADTRRHAQQELAAIAERVVARGFRMPPRTVMWGRRE